jgi:Domain of unknown function (DUF222)/HNH endonuclease
MAYGSDALQARLSVVADILWVMSETSSTVGTPLLIEAVEQIGSALDSVSDAATWALSDGDLTGGIAGVERNLARMYELRARLLAEADGRDLGRRLGASSTAAWLRDRFRLRPGDARRQVQLANRMAAAADGPVDYSANVGSALTGREMPATAAALAAGEISIEHAVIVARTMGRLPKQVSPEQAGQAERDLAGFARVHDPAVLSKLAAYLLHLLEADTLGDDEDDRRQKRELRFDDTTGALSGRLDAEGMATVRTALDALAKPNPAADGTPDPRSAGQRLADALVELARRALDSGDLPGSRGHAPHLMIIAGLDALAAGHACRDQAEAPEAGGSEPGGSEPGGSEPGGSEPGTSGSGSAAGRPGSDDCPVTAAGARGGVAPGEVLWGGPISAAAVRRIACYAGVQRVIIDPLGAVLDVGRQYRTITPPQYAALIARDGGCAFPGCTRPPVWCIAHHIIHWADGGNTDIDNLVLLCGYHHITIHHRGWDVTVAADRLPEFMPPSWIDPDRTPRRNNRPRLHLRPREPDG